MDITFNSTGRSGTAAWGAVLAMSLCVAILIASEFMPVSLLTPMAEGLGATTGQTGQAISISGLFAVAASLLVTTVAGRLNRKTVLLAITGMMLASLVLVAMAPNFTVLVLGRALLGICVGGFWALAAAVIMRLVPEADVSRALALMYGGQAIAAALAAPIGSYLGGIIGWREVFWALTPIVALNLVWLAVSLPSLPAGQRQSFGALIALLRRPYFVRGLLAATLTWGSAFTMFTYLRPFLEQVTGVDVTQLSALLLIVWGAMNTAMSVIWMTWMSRNVDDALEAAGSLMVAGIQASIMLGAAVGGLLLDALSIEATFTGSVLLALAALALIGSGRGLLKPEH